MALIEKAMPLGGAGLNFSIVGGTTQPTSPKENTIWINTDAAIGEWQFSSAEPTTRADGTALQNGDIWIYTRAGGNVAINTLKKNGIVVYPVSASQYINRAWVNITAQSYNNGTWNDWYDYLYNRGEEYAKATGGWVITNYGTKNATSMTIGSTGGVVNTISDCTTARYIDLTGFDMLTVNAIKQYSTTTKGYATINVIDTSGTTVASRVVYSGEINSTTETELSIDISNLSGGHKIQLVSGVYTTTETKYYHWIVNEVRLS